MRPLIQSPQENESDARVAAMKDQANAGASKALDAGEIAAAARERAARVWLSLEVPRLDVRALIDQWDLYMLCLPEEWWDPRFAGALPEASRYLRRQMRGCTANPLPIEGTPGGLYVLLHFCARTPGKPLRNLHRLILERLTQWETSLRERPKDEGRMRREVSGSVA